MAGTALLPTNLDPGPLAAPLAYPCPDGSNGCLTPARKPLGERLNETDRQHIRNTARIVRAKLARAYRGELLDVMAEATLAVRFPGLTWQELRNILEN